MLPLLIAYGHIIFFLMAERLLRSGQVSKTLKTQPLLYLFLQSVPIFEDFDSEQDRARLEAYVAASQTDKGIHLSRHRFVAVALKF